MRKTLTRVLACALLCTTAGCDKETLVSNRYCSLPARFSYRFVNSQAPLLHALNGPGQWCSISLEGRKIVFDNPAMTTRSEDNLVAQQGYTGFYLGLGNGLIVGLPNMPELGADRAVVTCYDHCCPNCWETLTVTKRLTLSTDGLATCGRCGRAYNLNSEGSVAHGPSGRALYRYRVFYGGNSLSISNP